MWLYLDDYNYTDWFVLLQEDDEKVPPMPPLEGDEKKSKKGEGVKILTPYKLLTRYQ